MKKPALVKDEIYHVYNRGVEKRKIFLNNHDYLRFVHDLFEFNDEDAVFNLSYYFKPSTNIEVQPRYFEKERKPRKLLVEILLFTLMPNHFHLLLRQKKENGIVKFMQKLGTGYTMYFNKKYERVGGLFQGRFKAALVNEERHFLHLPFYIHLNPADLINYRGSTSIEIMDYLKKYRWSSFPDYIGIKNFPSVTSREFFLEFFGGEKEYEKAIIEWLKEREKNIEIVNDVKLD